MPAFGERTGMRRARTQNDHGEKGHDQHRQDDPHIRACAEGGGLAATLRQRDSRNTRVASAMRGLAFKRNGSGANDLLHGRPAGGSRNARSRRSRSGWRSDQARGVAVPATHAADKIRSGCFSPGAAAPPSWPEIARSPGRSRSGAPPLLAFVRPCPWPCNRIPLYSPTGG